MKFDIKMVDLEKVSKVIYDGNSIQLEILPIRYLDSRLPRLPRKTSKQTNLQLDCNHIFEHAFEKVQGFFSSTQKFCVTIKVYKGMDTLGKGDLDNYCKAILDAITFTKKVWLDDKQVDEISMKRTYLQDLPQSKIELSIEKPTHN